MLPKSCLLAAVDLGSNSFRLEIDQYKYGHLRRREYLREPVRLGHGLSNDLLINPEAMERGWRYLDKLGRHLEQSSVHQVRAIATQTLRQAKNSSDFIEKAQNLLGHPIEVITGEEEAYLIYTGVTALLDSKKIHRGITSTEKRLVIDIGGRSTEIITGQGLKADVAYSATVGSVGLSVDYFSNGLMRAEQFEQAIADAKSHFQQAASYLQEHSMHELQWDAAYGASGTIGAISNVLRRNHITGGHITQEGLDWVYQQILQAKTMDNIHLAGLGDRRDVVGGGLSSLMALFATFKNLRSIAPARGALRQGVIYEMTLQPKLTQDPS